MAQIEDYERHKTGFLCNEATQTQIDHSHNYCSSSSHKLTISLSCAEPVLRLLVHRSESNHERDFIPQHMRLPVLAPALTFRTQLQIKLGDHSAHKQPHLPVGHVLRQTALRPPGKRLASIPFVGLVGRVTQPTLWCEPLGVSEIRRGVTSRVLMNRDAGPGWYPFAADDLPAVFVMW